MVLKKRNHKNDPIVTLNLALATILVDNDFRIRKNKNKKLYRTTIKEFAAKGFIRTHAFITNWLFELFEYGEITSLTFHEIMEKLPWSWDKTREYFDYLEEIGIVQYSRDSSGRKVCILTVDEDYKARQVENLVYLYKKYGAHSQVTISDARKEYLRYNKKLNEWQCKNKKVEKMSTEITQATSSKIDKFIFDVTNIISIAEKNELELNLLTFLKKNPLLIYSLKRNG